MDVVPTQADLKQHIADYKIPKENMLLSQCNEQLTAKLIINFLSTLPSNA
jgi:hypothetical protein